MTISIIQDETRSNGIEKQAIKTDPPVEPKNTEVTNTIKSEDTVVLKKEENQKEQKPNFNIFKAAWGVIKGFVKEIGTMIGFFFTAIIHPIKTIKTLCEGFKALCNLVINPRELASAFKNGWENFKSLDSDQKGQFIGRLLFNIIPNPTILNPLLINARLLSSLVIRPVVSTTAIAQHAKTLSRFYRVSGNNLKKTFLAARKIARRANLERDFQKALKLEGIPRELAPKLMIKSRKTLGAYDPRKHIVIVNKNNLDSFAPIGSMGKTVRHEIKHAGQALFIARTGIRPLTNSPEDLLLLALEGKKPRRKHPKAWKKAHELAPIKSGTELYEKAKQMKKLLKETVKRGREIGKEDYSILEHLKVHIKYFKDPLEKEARRAEKHYTGLAPAIPTPSMHNIPRLRPKEQKPQEENNKQNGKAFSQAA